MKWIGILDGKKIVTLASTTLEYKVWQDFMESGKRHVWLTAIKDGKTWELSMREWKPTIPNEIGPKYVWDCPEGATVVSTIFNGRLNPMDGSWFLGQINCDGEWQNGERHYKTYEEAERGHLEMVAQVLTRGNIDGRQRPESPEPV